MEMDLDIQNYSFEEILNLFKIPSNFDENDLKRAKRLVLKSHPDKSKLSPQYFIFYSKAYKILYSIYEFRNKTRLDQTTEYSIGEDYSHLDAYLEKNQLKDDKFYKWFNEEFEKRKDKEETQGYEDWFRSDENIETTTITLNEMTDFFNSKRVVVHEQIKEYSYGNNNYTNLLKEDAYHSDMFSSLHYSDLKQAHTNSVIPVSPEFKQFTDVNQYKKQRQMEDLKNVPLTEEQSKQFLQAKNSIEDEESVSRAYYYAKKTQESEKVNREFMSKMKFLEYKNKT